MKRRPRFSAVGIIGSGVQLAMLALLLRLHIHYLTATALAIQTALLHNYVWHRLWTWSGIRGSFRRLPMRLFAGSPGWPPMPSNLLAIVLTSLLNFAMASRWVFAAQRRSAPGGGYHVSQE